MRVGGPAAATEHSMIRRPPARRCGRGCVMKTLLRLLSTDDHDVDVGCEAAAYSYRPGNSHSGSAVVECRRMITAVLLTALLHTQASQAPPCPVADNDSYGYTRDQPVQVGGGAAYVAARERRYLDNLRGPEGQPLQYKRLGSSRQARTRRRSSTFTK